VRDPDVKSGAAPSLRRFDPYVVIRQGTAGLSRRPWSGIRGRGYFLGQYFLLTPLAGVVEFPRAGKPLETARTHLEGTAAGAAAEVGEATGGPRGGEKGTISRVNLLATFCRSKSRIGQKERT
jgi:hypothetical protein